MSRRTISLEDSLYDYMLSVSLREPELLRRLREETAELPQANMQISPEQGQFMAFLVELMSIDKALEVGVFTGYSTLCVALALPPGGRLVACDVNEEWSEVARRYWAEAGVADRIDLRLAAAIETLDGLLADGQGETFGFAFIDADKANYERYYERILSLLKPGGLVCVDNVLWDGSVIDGAKQDADTRAIRAFNRLLHEDTRVSLSLVPIGDGLTLARKRFQPPGGHRGVSPRF